MQPSWTSFHAALFGVAIFLLALLGDKVTSSIAVGCAAFALLFAIALNTNYARVLSRKPRSTTRASGDRVVAIAVLIAIPVPLAYAAVATHVSTLRVAPGVLHSSSIRAFVGCTAAIAIEFVFLSSLVDWYVIKAWRDGIVAEPPCRRANRRTWLNITRWWLHHRIVATVGFFIGLWTSIGLGWFELANHFKTSAWGYYLIALISPSLIPAFLMRGYLAELGHAIGLAWGNLKIALGDEVAWKHNGQRFSGIAYDVSIDGGYRIIERDGSSRYLSLSDARHNSGVDIDQRRPPPWACEAVCESEVDGACDFRATRDNPSSRWLIL